MGRGVGRGDGGCGGGLEEMIVDGEELWRLEDGRSVIGMKS